MPGAAVRRANPGDVETISRSLARAFEANSLGPVAFLFVDDGSRDRSAEIIRGFREADLRVRLVRLKENAGETAATDAGFKATQGRCVVVMDADLQNDPHDIPRLLHELDQWDAVTGWRVKRGDGDSVVRRISSRLANRVRNWISHEVVQDSGCTFRAFRRECLRGLVLYRGFHRFIPTLLKMRGYRVVEIPVDHRPRRFGQSKYGVLKLWVPAATTPSNAFMILAPPASVKVPRARWSG